MNDDKGLLDELLACERLVWEAFVAGDAGADLAALAPEFLGVYASGFSDRASHAAPLLKGALAAGYVIEDARVMALGPDHALIAYRARWLRPGADQARDYLISSVWRRRAAGGWENVFSQDTEAAKG